MNVLIESVDRLDLVHLVFLRNLLIDDDNKFRTDRTDERLHSKLLDRSSVNTALSCVNTADHA